MFLMTRFYTQMVLVSGTVDQVPHVQITFFLKHPAETEEHLFKQSFECNFVHQTADQEAP